MLSGAPVPPDVVPESHTCDKSALAALQGHPVLQAELERVREGKPMEALDVTRYRLDKPPLARRNDFAAWRKALENAHSQLGHQYNRCGGQQCMRACVERCCLHCTGFGVEM
jgi:Breast carcinoma amplified sequence 2 (BCAS2)